MKRTLIAAAVVSIAALAAPRPASGQHTAPAGSSSSGTAVSSGGGGSSGGSSSGGSSSSSGGSSGGSVAPADSSNNSSGRRRGNLPVTGTAVRRSGQPGGGGGPISIGVGGFYPWGYVSGGGLGIYDAFYGGYYGAYDPWYGFSPIYAPSSSYARDESGSIRLQVKPSDASVYVDGYYVGIVDDFDGAFQRLHLEPGPHHLEIRAVDHGPLSLDVWITEDLTITYRGDLKP
jgi:hypothetical protein